MASRPAPIFRKVQFGAFVFQSPKSTHPWEPGVFLLSLNHLRTPPNREGKPSLASLTVLGIAKILPRIRHVIKTIIFKTQSSSHIDFSRYIMGKIHASPLLD